MPYKRKDSPIWWVSFTDSSGERIRRSTETTDRKEAEALEAKWKLEAFRTKQWDEQPSRTFDQLMVAYLTATESEKRGRGHRRAVDATKPLKGFFTGRELGQIGAPEVRAYIAQRKMGGVGPATINRELAVFSSAINYARSEWDWDIQNPIMGRKLKEPEGRVRWLTKAEAGRLLTEAQGVENAEHLRDFILVALHTGMRRGEILGLEWKRVDLKAGLVILEAHHTKAGKRRSIPLNKTAREAILSRARFRAKSCPAAPWVFAHEDGTQIKDVKRSFGTACKRAGIDDFTPHDLRHTCAAWLVSAGVPLTEVRDLLGHSTVKMTERYAHLAPENVRAAVERLDGSGHDPVTLGSAGPSLVRVTS